MEAKSKSKQFVLVPVEPTEDMVVAGHESWPDLYFSKPEVWEAFERMTGCQQAAHKARLCYAAMIAAAPTEPQADELQAQKKFDALLGTNAASLQQDSKDAQDARRYRFLRDQAFGANGHLALLPPEQMDSAVDAEIKKSQRVKP